MGNVSVSRLSEAIQTQLSGYADEVTEDLKAEVKAAAKECLAAIRDKSPRDTGSYAAGWREKLLKETSSSVSEIIYNAKHGSRTHLLENGHEKVGGGRVEGIPHIGPAEEALKDRLIKNAKILVSDR